MYKHNINPINSKQTFSSVTASDITNINHNPQQLRELLRLNSHHRRTIMVHCTTEVNLSSDYKSTHIHNNYRSHVILKLAVSKYKLFTDLIQEDAYLLNCCRATIPCSFNWYVFVFIKINPRICARK